MIFYFLFVCLFVYSFICFFFVFLPATRPQGKSCVVGYLCQVRLMIEKDKQRHAALREELQQRHEEEVAARQAKKASQQRSIKPSSKNAKGKKAAAPSKPKFRTQPKQPKKPLFLRMQEQFHEKVRDGVVGLQVGDWDVSLRAFNKTKNCLFPAFIATRAM